MTLAFPSVPKVLLLDALPDVRQSTDYSCGPSALQAVLAYYGIEATEEQLIREAKTDPAIGAEMENLAEVAEHRGLKAKVCEDCRLEDLERELAMGYPVIVLNQSWREQVDGPWSEEWDSGHYVIVIGMDAGRVYVEDPSLKGSRGWLPRQEFVERWHDWARDNKRRAWGQVIFIHGRPPGQVPRVIHHFERVE